MPRLWYQGTSTNKLLLMQPHRWLVTSLASAHRVTDTIPSQPSQQKTGCYISNSPDKIITSLKYETADEYHKRILEKVSF